MLLNCHQLTRIGAVKLSWEDETTVHLEQDYTRVQVDGESEGLEGIRSTWTSPTEISDISYRHPFNLCLIFYAEEDLTVK